MSISIDKGRSQAIFFSVKWCDILKWDIFISDQELIFVCVFHPDFFFTFLFKNSLCFREIERGGGGWVGGWDFDSKTFFYKDCSLGSFET